jgi:hypothetical protein
MKKGDHDRLFNPVKANSAQLHDVIESALIDFVLNDESGVPRIFVEGKLSEHEFGSYSVFVAGGDCCRTRPARMPASEHLIDLFSEYWIMMDLTEIHKDLTSIFKEMYFERLKRSTAEELKVHDGHLSGSWQQLLN